MARDLSAGGAGALAQPGAIPELSPTMRKILDRRQVRASYGGEAGNHGGGDFAPGAWIPPAWVDPREQAEAIARLPAYRAQRAPDAESVAIFLEFLWASAKHQKDQSWEAIARVYPAMLARYPRWCFRLEQTQEACFHFSWFPSLADLSAWLDHDCRRFLHDLNGLEVVAKASTTRPKDMAPESERQAPEWGWTRQQAEDHGRILRDRWRQESEDLARLERERCHNHGREAAVDHVPQRIDGEDIDSFLARQKAFRDRVLGKTAEVLETPSIEKRSAVATEQARQMDNKRRTAPDQPEQIAVSANLAKAPAMEAAQ